MSTFSAAIREIREEATGIKTFVVDRPDDFTFMPGQYCWISIPQYKAAPMAIASGNTDTTLEFSIRAWGELTTALFELAVGDQIDLDGPYGSAFPMEAVTNGRNIHMIAGGTGITPIRSLTRSLKEKGNKRIYYGAKNPGELLYLSELNQWPGTIFLTVDEGDDSWKGKVGLVTTLLEELQFQSDDLFFVCGPKPMEAAVTEFLLKQPNIQRDNIYVSLEKFDDEGKVVGPVLPVTHTQVSF